MTNDSLRAAILGLTPATFSYRVQL